MDVDHFSRIQEKRKPRLYNERNILYVKTLNIPPKARGTIDMLELAHVLPPEFSVERVVNEI